MAAGADDVLQNARVVPDVRTAIADCGLVVGTTARGRHLSWRIVEPRAAALEIAAASQASEVAILFGAVGRQYEALAATNLHRQLFDPLCDWLSRSIGRSSAVHVQLRAELGRHEEVHTWFQ